MSSFLWIGIAAILHLSYRQGYLVCDSPMQHEYSVLELNLKKQQSAIW